MCASHLQADDGEQSVKQVRLLYICPTGHLDITPSPSSRCSSQLKRACGSLLYSSSISRSSNIHEI